MLKLYLMFNVLTKGTIKSPLLTCTLLSHLNISKRKLGWNHLLFLQLLQNFLHYPFPFRYPLRKIGKKYPQMMVSLQIFPFPSFFEFYFRPTNEQDFAMVNFDLELQFSEEIFSYLEHRKIYYLVIMYTNLYFKIITKYLPGSM